MKRLQKALEKTYTGRMDVYGFVDMETDWGETRQEKRLLMENQLCVLSQKDIVPVGPVGGATRIQYQAKLFIGPKVRLAAGSEVIIRQDGMQYRFIHSGEAFRYASHQEIMIERLEYA